MLSGDIKVNTELFGQWQAVRTEPLEEGRETYTYNCEAFWRGGDRWLDFEFQVQHDRSKGAFVLAQRVLAAALDAERAANR